MRDIKVHHTCLQAVMPETGWRHVCLITKMAALMPSPLLRLLRFLLPLLQPVEVPACCSGRQEGAPRAGRRQQQSLQVCRRQGCPLPDEIACCLCQQPPARQWWWQCLSGQHRRAAAAEPGSATAPECAKKSRSCAHKE